MRRLAELVTQDLSNIHGARESGPNGAKKEYLNTGKTFFRAMAKDLGFVESKVYANLGGIAVNGEVCIMGMWNDESGIYIMLRQEDLLGCILYRRISHIKDYRGGRNRFLSKGVLCNGSYDELLKRFFEIKKEEIRYASAA